MSGKIELDQITLVKWLSEFQKGLQQMTDATKAFTSGLSIQATTEAVKQDLTTQELADESKHVINAFPPELQELLLFEYEENDIIIKPAKYLGSDNFGKVADIIRNQLGGQYISAGRDSHFTVPRTPQQPQEQATTATQEPIPNFNTENLVNADWKGKRLGHRKYAKAPSWGGFLFRNDLTEETIKALQKGPLTIGDYTYNLTEKIVQRNKVRR